MASYVRWLVMLVALVLAAGSALASQCDPTSLSTNDQTIVSDDVPDEAWAPPQCNLGPAAAVSIGSGQASPALGELLPSPSAGLRLATLQAIDSDLPKRE